MLLIWGALNWQFHYIRNLLAQQKYSPKMETQWRHLAYSWLTLKEVLKNVLQEEGNDSKRKLRFRRKKYETTERGESGKI